MSHENQGQWDRDRVLLPWGKLCDESNYHPALFHMLDVGNVARLLLSPEASPRYRAVMGAALCADPEWLSAWLPLLVALHDIGKISNPFQGQESTPETQSARQRLLRQGFEFDHTYGESYRHQQISAVWVQRVWPQVEPGVPDSLVRAEQDALGGHHGVFSPPGDLIKVRKYLKREEGPEWAALRADVYQVLRAELAADWHDWPCPRHLRAATVVLAGLTILCDWIGSDERYFVCEPSMTLGAYRPLSEQRARSALSDPSFLRPRGSATYPGFSSLFPRIDEPSPLQTTIDKIPDSVLVWPGLFIIEAPTGEGKTETALALARRLAVTGPSDEMYFGLPTQATSNQMYGKVYSFLNPDNSADSPVKLVHGQSFLAEDGLLLRLQRDADSGSTIAASQWFAPKKRSLLAQYGVGTVDQIELTTLNARHYVLRLFGLAGKVVIVDEIHAYDTYMNTILEEAVAWLASVGSSVILLSATLPNRRHRALAKAFYRGLPEEVRPALPREDLPYPCLAAYVPGEPKIFEPAARQLGRDLTVQFVADETVEAQAGRILTAVKDGGAICRICNTVGAAQDLFDEVRHQDPTVEPLLLHSRFPSEERLQIEERLSELFGPGSTRPEGERYIVIGTQVLEQSLDLDFDAMISDHSPLDLLLQRAGRLHRHAGRRALTVPEPVLLVQLPTGTDGRPDFGSWALVYDAYTLWTSWLVLQRRLDGGEARLRLPADYRPLIEAAYPDGEVLLQANNRFSAEIHAAYQEHTRAESRMGDEARIRLIPEPDSHLGITERAVLQLEEDEGGNRGWGVAKTRLGAESVTIIPLHLVNDRLAVDPVGHEIVPKRCTRDWQLRLLRRSFPVTVTLARRPLLERWLRDRDEHTNIFDKDSLLRHAVPLILDGGRQRVGSYAIRLDPRLGLTIRKEPV